MEARALCINDRGRPTHIPKNKWVEKGKIYTVVYAVMVMPQERIAFHLAEIDLTEDHLPYEYFLSERFAFSEKGLIEVGELIDFCLSTNPVVEQFLAEIQA
jgi:hypothetical protein